MSVGIQQRFDRNSAYLAVSLVAYALEMKAEDILQPDRGPRELVRARQVAMYLTHVGLGMSLSRVAIAFERDRSTVAHACHRIEEMRDDADYDAWLEALEQGLATVAPLLARAA
ncbi:MAG: chromosomal replication initiator DnaA [Hyphomonadaceae bacterium]|nr:chromosomal replication initiator DnaA [Hyphomonadaceae bacterium]